jgi:hypothetical protein
MTVSIVLIATPAVLGGGLAAVGQVFGAGRERTRPAIGRGESELELVMASHENVCCSLSKGVYANAPMRTVAAIDLTTCLR